VKVRGPVAEASLLLLGFIAGLLSLEALVRVASPSPLRRSGYSIVRGGASFRPENSAGYRDFEHPKKKPPGVHRAVFVGDSFTYGAGVLFEDAFPRRVARGLTTDRNEPWEAVVLAIPGIDTEREAAIVREEAFAYEPDLLFVAYVLNDAFGREADEQRRAVAWQEEQKGAQGPPRWWRRSALLSLVKDRLDATTQNRARIRNYRALYQDDHPGYRSVLRGMKEIATLAQEHRVPLIVAVFPLFGNPMDRGYPFEAVHQKLASDFRSLPIMYLDLLPFYRGLDWKLLVVEGGADEHPNEIAHRIAAEALLRLVDGPQNHAGPEPPT
jgi:hypothetical protein